MSFIDYQAPRRLLIMTRGHPFDREAFYSLFDEIPGFEPCAVEQPASQQFFAPELAADYAAFVLYDMPGMDFLRPDPGDGMAPSYMEPPAAFQANFLALLEQGHGFVFLHHALAAWPAWEEYADIVGARFLYKPEQGQGAKRPDSGYRHEVDQRITVLTDHPVTAGVSRQFSLSDELYLFDPPSSDVVPLLSSDYSFDSPHFYSAQQAVKGELYSREGWQHPPGTALLGWAKHYKNSPIVYLQCGDSKAAYDNPDFRRLLGNAVNWVSSDEAHSWARQQNLE